MSKKSLPKLFKYTSKGQVQEWQIFVEHDRFYTTEGISGGKLTTSLPTICYGKNIGRSNQTSPFDQAEKEAQAKWQKKVDSGYNEVLSAEKKFFEPMLAKVYEGDDIDWSQKVYIQPKLDGLRCINDGKSLMSRNGKPFHASHLHHGTKVLLDGELYNHEFRADFNEIVGIFKRENKSAKELKDCEEKGQMWVYDLPSAKGTFSERYEALQEWYKTADKNKFKLVPTYLVKSHSEVKQRHKKFMDDGYEGSIIRLDGLYENKRSKNLLKYKDWMDAEFKIIGCEEGEGGRTGTIGKFILDFPDGLGAKTFSSNVKGNFAYLTKIWVNRDSYIGKSATVEFQNYTPIKGDKGGVPRFPYVIKIDRESYE